MKIRIFLLAIIIIVSTGTFNHIRAQDAVLVIAADKMNVFYMGIDNPVSIAVSGISADKISATINNGTITGNNGKYSVKISKSENAIIEVSAGEKKVGKQEFRVYQPISDCGKKNEEINTSKPESEKSVLAIASDHMNILYMGVDNPVTIAVSGIAAEKISATTDNGSISGNNGKYIIKVVKNDSAIIEVSVDGKKIGKQKFFVKRVPAPVAYVGGYSGDVNIPKFELEKIETIFPGFKDFPFDCNLKFPIKSFHLSCKSTQGFFKNDMEYGNVKDGIIAMKELFKEAKQGDKIYITDIWVKAPDGLRTLPAINITVK